MDQASAQVPGSGQPAPMPGDPGATQGGPITVALRGAEQQLERLGRELTEVEMLAHQAAGEVGRQDQRRAQAADRLAALQSRRDAEPDELREASTQLVTLTRRSAMMEAQVEVLTAKQQTLTRYRDHLTALLDALRVAVEQTPDEAEREGNGATELPLPASVSRAILSAQEDMRRDIARAMHDGPAQSLTNIVLQAQIVERLVRGDPEAALLEAGRLIEVVQHALDATKAFIFDVRPMVLDDLGLVPTLRRLARDRGRGAAVPIEFDSVGADRRLEVDLETGLFRMIDQAIVGYLARQPSRIAVTLTWEPHSLAARVQAAYVAETVLTLPPDMPIQAEAAPRTRGKREQGEDLPPALAAMIRDQQADDEARAAQPPRDQGLGAAAWRDIEQRAHSLGIAARLDDAGRCLDLVLESTT